MDKSLGLPLDRRIIHRRLAPSRRWYSFTYLGRMESCVSSYGKDGLTNIQILAEPGSNWGPCGRKAEIFQLRQPCPPINMFRFYCNLLSFSSFKLVKFTRPNGYAKCFYCPLNEVIVFYVQNKLA